MANAAIAAWSVKFLDIVKQLPVDINRYNNTVADKNLATNRARTSLLATTQTLLSLRAELSGIFAASTDISPSTATSILPPLDKLLNPLNSNAWLGKGDKNGRNNAKFSVAPLVKWFEQYIKPLI
jgi:hypothetical protein